MARLFVFTKANLNKLVNDLSTGTLVEGELYNLSQVCRWGSGDAEYYNLNLFACLIKMPGGVACFLHNPKLRQEINNELLSFSINGAPSAAKLLKKTDQGRRLLTLIAFEALNYTGETLSTRLSIFLRRVKEKV